MYEQALELNLDPVPEAKTYIENKYQLNREVLKYDEQLISSGLVIPKEEADKIVSDFIERSKIIESVRIRIPFWMSFFMIRE